VKTTKEIIPVLHMSNKDNLNHNISIIKSLNIKKIFIINHDYQTLDEIKEEYNYIKSKIKNIWIGINCLTSCETKIFTELSNERFFPDAVWIDNSAIQNSYGTKNRDKIYESYLEYKEKGFQGRYFGGFAFKYQKQPLNLEKATIEATDFIDIITTSGNGTGVKADIEKIKTIYKNVNNKNDIAIASGITPDNIKDYIPFINYFLIATGISESFYRLSLEKTKQVINTLNQFKK